MNQADVLALVGGHVDAELLARNEYLAAENEILKSKFEKPPRLTDPERIRLARLGKRIGLKALKGIACIVKPETILRWFRELAAKKFDGSKQRKAAGRPKTNPKIERLILEFALDNPGWG